MNKDLHVAPPPMRATKRFVIAYWTTFVVMGSYFWLRFLSRFLGQEFREKRITDLHKKNARRIETTILRLQGLFIKVGQLISIMTNFLPEEFRSDLENLQDSVPDRPWSQVEQRIKEELGKAPDQVFATFNKKPIASASLGQVHEATLTTGERVAVKVQHIGVEEMSQSDLKTIRRILGIIKLMVKVQGLDNVYHEIRAMILEELDFTKEASNIESITANFEGNEGVKIPRVYKEFSTNRVMTLEFVDGVKITEREKIISAGLDPDKVAKELVTAYCQMIFVDGFYHADPHPGNVLVSPQGKIIFVDFGAVGILSPSMREGISMFFEAIIKADESQLLMALKHMGFLQVGSQEAESASRVIEHFHRKFQDEISIDNFSLSSVKIDPKKGLENLSDLRQMDVGIRELSAAFHIPKEWVLLERTALLLTGLCTHLAPQMKPTETIWPYLEEFVLGKDRDWSEMMIDFIRERVISILSLPGKIEKAIERTLDGRVEFKVKGIEDASSLLYSAGHQLIYTLLVMASAGCGLYFHHFGEHEMARWSVYSMGGFGTLLFLSMVKARRYRRK